MHIWQVSALSYLKYEIVVIRMTSQILHNFVTNDLRCLLVETMYITNNNSSFVFKSHALLHETNKQHIIIFRVFTHAHRSYHLRHLRNSYCKCSNTCENPLHLNEAPRWSVFKSYADLGKPLLSFAT